MEVVPCAHYQTEIRTRKESNFSWKLRGNSLEWIQNNLNKFFNILALLYIKYFFSV